VDAFGFILIGMVVAGVIVACLSYIGSGGLYSGVGRPAA